MSSSGFPQIEFGYDEGSETEDGDEEDDDDDSISPDDQVANGNLRPQLALKRTRSGSKYQRPFKTILYISMAMLHRKSDRLLAELTPAKSTCIHLELSSSRCAIDHSYLAWTEPRLGRGSERSSLSFRRILISRTSLCTLTSFYHSSTIARKNVHQVWSSYKVASYQCRWKVRPFVRH